MRMKMALLAGSILALPALAQAQPVDGLYVGAGAGANWLLDEHVKGINFGPPHSVGGGEAKSDVGFTGMFNVGYGFGNGLRVELEGDYLRNGISSVAGLGNGSGHEAKYGALANVLYDIDLTPFGIDFMTPYVGAGVGYLWNNWNSVTASGTTSGGAPVGLSVNKQDGGLALQGIVGVSFPLTQFVPGLSLTVDYRFLDQPQDRKDTADLITKPETFTGKLKLGSDLNNIATVGFRYVLYQPAPPPPPAPAPVAAPAPAPTRTYLVFFDWDKADLTERARQIISQAAQNSTRVKYTRIEVNGYTDRSGTPAYNQKLSIRRAQSVAAELVKDGVPQGAIDIQGFGETHPLVPTAAGVREPQNRRVEIILK